MQCKPPGCGWPKTLTKYGILNGWVHGLRPLRAANAYASCATSHPFPTLRKQYKKLLLTHQPGQSTSSSKPRQHSGYGNTLTSCRPADAPSCEHYSPTIPHPTPKSPPPLEFHPAESDPHETEHSSSYEKNSTNTTRFRSSRAAAAQLCKSRGEPAGLR